MKRENKKSIILRGRNASKKESQNRNRERTRDK